MYKIFIVEDDSIISSAIQKHIESWGYDAVCAVDFKNIITEFIEYVPQLVLLDVNLPFFNGYHWCKEIRKISNVPIIFISSASDNMNIVMAMNMGGDDYITKPFDLDILTAKIQAVLRRTYDFSAQSSLLQHKGAILNIDDTTLAYNGQKIELTKNEYKILKTLMQNKGKAITRDTLMTKLWETDSYVDENTLTVNIARLRKKLENIGLFDFIITKKGIGYLIEV